MLEQNEKNVDNTEEINHIENIEGEKSMKLRFIDTLKASLIDLIVIGAISTALVFIADSILRLTGYFVTQKFQMSFIIFMVVMVLYMSIMESGKTCTTIGKKLSGLTIIKG
ncbi:RDD family protein [Clostridium sp.]|jgi:uncharacterized RDD family membrane protein YckC|uniref:RDD family protein n=1 Tax=Clostridium sp. TaxID=1506 RepID=UPI003EEA88A2